MRRRSIALAPRHHGPGDAGRLVGQRYRDQLLRLSGDQGEEPRIGRCWIALGGPKPRGRAIDQQAAQVSIPHLGDPSQALVAAARPLQRCQPEPGGKLPARGELSRIADRGRQSAGGDEADTRNALEPPGNLVAAEPRHQLLFHFLDTDLQVSELSGQQEDHLGRDRRHFDDRAIEKSIDKPERMLNPFGNGNAELGQLATDYVHQLGALAATWSFTTPVDSAVEPTWI